MIIALLYLVISIFLCFVNPLWGFISIMGSVLFRFQDRYEVIAQWPTFFILIIALCMSMLIHKDKIVKTSFKQSRILVCFVVYAALGLLIRNPSDLISEVKHLVAPITFYFFASKLIRNKKDLISVLFFLSAFTAVLAFEAVHAYVTDPNTIFLDPLTGRLQGIGLYANANEFGKIMLTALPFIYLFIRVKKSVIVRLISITVIILMCSVVALTLSRTCAAILAFMIVFTSLIDMNIGYFKKGMVAVLLVIAMTIGIEYMPGKFQERTASIKNYSTDKSLEGRTDAWEEGIRMVSWYPIFGVGKGQWSNYHGRAPHNTYVKVLAETGIPGFIMFMWIIVLSIKSFNKIYKDRKIALVDPVLRKVNNSMMVSFSGYLIYVFFGNHAYAPWTYFYFGLFAALEYIYNSVSAEDDEKTVTDEITA